MAKKETEKAEVAQPESKATNKMVEVVIEKPVDKKPKWEIKDRVYYLNNKKRPLSYMVKSAGIYFFDEKKGYERELKYCENQKTSFVDDMQGDQRLAHIIFRNGALHVPRNKQTLQKLLSLYHPHRDVLFSEYKPEIEAADELDFLEMELEALNIAQAIDVDTTEAIMWYLYDRFDPDGKIIPMIDENTGLKYTFKKPSDLFKFLKYRSSIK